MPIVEGIKRVVEKLIGIRRPGAAQAAGHAIQRCPGVAPVRVTLPLDGANGARTSLQAGDVAICPAGTGHWRVRASRDLLVVDVACSHADPVYGKRGLLLLLWRPLASLRRQLTWSRTAACRAAKSARA
jgi:hypothetical protein